MSPGSLTVLLSFISFLAILVSGSPRGFAFEQSLRHRRHASCPSCGKDCPGTLSSPWYGRRVYEGGPGREYRVQNREIYPRWVRSYAYPRDRQVTAYPFLPQYPREVSTFQRENPFVFRGSRSIDPYAPPTQSASSFRLHRRPSPDRRNENDESWALKVHEPSEADHGKYPSAWNPNEARGDLIEPRKAYFPVHGDDRRMESGDDGRDNGRDNEGDENGLRREDGTERTVNRAKLFGATGESREGSGGFWGNGRGFTLERHYPRTSEHGNRLSFVKPDAIRQENAPRKLHDDLSIRKRYRDSGSYDPRAFRASNVPIRPEIKYNPYNLPSDLNVMKMIKNMEDQSAIFRNQNSWREDDSEPKQSEASEENEKDSSEEESAEEMKRVEDEDSSPDFATQDESKTVASEEISSEKSAVESEEEEQEQDDESFADREIDIFEDIENPPADPTEPTTVDSFTESTTMPE